MLNGATWDGSDHPNLLRNRVCDVDVCEVIVDMQLQPAPDKCQRPSAILRFVQCHGNRTVTVDEDRELRLCLLRRVVLQVMERVVAVLLAGAQSLDVSLAALLGGSVVPHALAALFAVLVFVFCVELSHF